MTNQTHILVADDDPVIRHLVSSVLTAAGFRVSVTASGAECLLRVAECTAEGDLPQAAVVDFMLGDMSGVDLIREIRGADTPRFPILMLSANSRDEVFSEDVGPDFYLEKPFQPASLISTLRDALNGEG